jgi:hypothetical protein
MVILEENLQCKLNGAWPTQLIQGAEATAVANLLRIIEFFSAVTSGCIRAFGNHCERQHRVDSAFSKTPLTTHICAFLTACSFISLSSLVDLTLGPRFVSPPFRVIDTAFENATIDDLVRPLLLA